MSIESFGHNVDNLSLEQSMNLMSRGEVIQQLGEFTQVTVKEVTETLPILIAADLIQTNDESVFMKAVGHLMAEMKAISTLIASIAARMTEDLTTQELFVEEVRKVPELTPYYVPFGHLDGTYYRPMYSHLESWKFAQSLYDCVRDICC